MHPRWIETDSLVNLRDVGGTSTTDGGEIAPGRLLRSDNLQNLTDADIEQLIELGVTDVVDLRSDWEAGATGPSPLSSVGAITVRRHSMFHETAPGVGQDKPEVREDALPEEALPWVDLEPAVELAHPMASLYMDYVINRPDSVVAALREIAGARGATLVHCAAGKDRTGTIVALALAAAGAEPAAIVADYAASTERTEAIVAKLMASPVYAENLRGRPIESHHSQPAAMQALLDHIDAAYGGVPALLRSIGFGDDDLAALRAKLRD